MKLEDTITMMTSKDEKERFKAEYWQAKIRCQEVEQKHKQKVEEAQRNRDSNSEVQIDVETASECLRMFMLKASMEKYIQALELVANLRKIDLNSGG
jgi:hypothetical protein